MNNFINIDFLKERMISAIVEDKKNKRTGLLRYELFKDWSGCIIRVNRNMFDCHTSTYTQNGLFEFNRIHTDLDGIPCVMVIMRHPDEDRQFWQFDGLLGGYMQAGCEQCYYEVDMDKVELKNQ